jgi:hypothetical protein
MKTQYSSTYSQKPTSVSHTTALDIFPALLHSYNLPTVITKTLPRPLVLHYECGNEFNE